jgi:hypothetical protein
MTKAEAQKLVARLNEAYSNISLTEGSVALYVEKLVPLDAEIGSRAVEAAIAESEFFPSLAVIFRCVGEVKAEEKRKRDEVEQRERYASEDEIERLPIAEIPGLPEFLTRLNVGYKVADKPVPFRRTEIGICDDCLADRRALFTKTDPVPVPRYLVGKVKVCYECAAKRLRVGAKLEEEEKA